MNERIKHRLVGAVVLVSFVVIVVPMILKPPLERDKSVSASSTSPPTKGGLEAGSHVSGRAQDSQLGEHATSPSHQSHRQPTVEERLAGNANNGIDEKRQVGAQPLDGSTEVRRNGVKITEATGEAVSLTAAAGVKTKTWVVQLGSFSKRENAVALRDRLQAEGYHAFIRPTAASHAGLTIVYVGLELSKDEARQLSRVLGKETKLKGLVVPYP